MSLSRKGNDVRKQKPAGKKRVRHNGPYNPFGKKPDVAAADFGDVDESQDAPDTSSDE